MIDRIKNLPVASNARRALETVQSWLAPALLRRRTFAAALVASLLAIIYWGMIASDRYVSEAQIVIERTDMSVRSSMDIGSLLSGAANGSHGDQMMLRTHLLSVNMLNKLDAKLDLRGHYSHTHAIRSPGCGARTGRRSGFIGIILVAPASNSTIIRECW